MGIELFNLIVFGHKKSMTWWILCTAYHNIWGITLKPFCPVLRGNCSWIAANYNQLISFYCIIIYFDRFRLLFELFAEKSVLLLKVLIRYMFWDCRNKALAIIRSCLKHGSCIESHWSWEYAVGIKMENTHHFLTHTAWNYLIDHLCSWSLFFSAFSLAAIVLICSCFL